ncbi:MAG: hypothetical protein AAGF04_03885 [Chlamydiota bacterium]
MPPCSNPRPQDSRRYKSATETLADWTEDLISYLKEEQPTVFLENPLLLADSPAKIREKKSPTSPQKRLLKQVTPTPPIASPKEKQPVRSPAKEEQKKPISKEGEEKVASHTALLSLQKNKESYPFSPPDDLADVEATVDLLQLFPILREIPSDRTAHERQKAYLHQRQIAPVTVLRFDERDEKRCFLEHVALAISLHIAPAKVASYTKNWDLPQLLKTQTCHCFIAEKAGLFSAPRLLEQYQENGEGTESFLAGVRLICLEEITTYFFHPEKKQDLWKLLTTILPELCPTQK